MGRLGLGRQPPAAVIYILPPAYPGGRRNRVRLVAAATAFARTRARPWREVSSSERDARGARRRCRRQPDRACAFWGGAVGRAFALLAEPSSAGPTPMNIAFDPPGLAEARGAAVAADPTHSQYPRLVYLRRRRRRPRVRRAERVPATFAGRWRAKPCCSDDLGRCLGQVLVNRANRGGDGNLLAEA